MKTSIITIILALFAMGSLQAQSINQIQYAAYLKAGKSLWERSVEISKKTHGEVSFEATLAAFGLLNNTMATQDEATFDANVDQVVEQLKQIIKEQPDWGEPKAVLSSVYGLKMAYSPMKGIVYGGKSGSLMEASVKLQPESPLVQKLYGSYRLYTPDMFGGDAAEAVKAYSKAVAIYEQSATEENWLYLDSLVGLAMAHQKNNSEDLAIEVLEKALQIEPEFHWAKSLLKSYKDR